MITAAEEHIVEALGWAVLVAGWLASMFAAWRLTTQLSRRPWLPLLAGAFVFWLPFWDFIPGLVALNTANHLFGGLHVYQRVTAAGYLDLSRASALEVWGTLAASPYQYIEIYSGRRPLSSANDPAYYELRLAPRESPDCTAFEAGPIAKTFHMAFGLPDRCPVVDRRESAFSRYALQMSAGWQARVIFGWFRPIDERWVRVVDHDSNTTLADARIFRYRPWLDELGLDLRFERAADAASIEQFTGRLITTVVRPAGIP